MWDVTYCDIVIWCHLSQIYTDLSWDVTSDQVGSRAVDLSRRRCLWPQSTVMFQSHAFQHVSNTCPQHILCPYRQNNNTYGFVSFRIASICGSFLLHGFLWLLWRRKWAGRHKFDSLPFMSLLRFSALHYGFSCFHLWVHRPCLQPAAAASCESMMEQKGPKGMLTREHKRTVDLEWSWKRTVPMAQALWDYRIGQGRHSGQLLLLHRIPSQSCHDVQASSYELAQRCSTTIWSERRNRHATLRQTHGSDSPCKCIWDLL